MKGEKPGARVAIGTGGIPSAFQADVADETESAGLTADADQDEVTRAVVRVVDTPKGRRPFRVHIHPADDGAEEVNAFGDRIRAPSLSASGSPTR